MATVARLARLSDPAALGRRPSCLRDDPVGLFARDRLCRATRSPLVARTDRELADLGVRRGAIRELALSAACEV